MKRNLLLRIAAGLCIVTCIAHLIGTFMEIPAEQTEMLEAVSVMKETLVPMPVGSAKTYMQILDGNNLSTALFLLLCGVLLIAGSGSGKDQRVERMLLIVALSLIGFAVISVIYFFPIPAIFTGSAALLTLIARSTNQL